MRYIEEKELLIEYGKKMSTDGLSPGTGGNLSIYIPEDGVVLITPSGIGYFDIQPEDIVEMTLDGEILASDKKPSSEWHLHTLFYKNKPGIRGIVHTHSMFCATLSAFRMPIKPIHYVVADANAKEIPCADYVRYGTEELAIEAVKVAGDSNAVLLANHGLVTCGKDLRSAYNLASNLEYVAEIQCRALSMGQPTYLTDEEMDEVLEGFKTYGQQKEEK